ncbi:unnamed protein product [Colias eurytheme]|nr:unnamed protein product [Colias eurytheme]
MNRCCNFSELLIARSKMWGVGYGQVAQGAGAGVERALRERGSRAPAASEAPAMRELPASRPPPQAPR